MTPEEYEAKVNARIDRMRKRAEKVALESGRTLQNARELGARIPMGQPILVGHHSEKRHRRDIARINAGHQKAYELADEAKSLTRRADAAERNQSVSSDDPSAVRKLGEKLAGLERDLGRMKKANALIRARASVADVASATGLSEARAAKLFEKDFAGRIGFPDYAITNTGAEIRRVKKRIEELGAANIAPVRVTETIGDVQILQSDNRVRMLFPGKPDEATRTALKKRGFKWSPTAGAWQRMASNGAWYDARTVAEMLRPKGASSPPPAPAPVTACHTCDEARPSSSAAPPPRAPSVRPGPSGAPGRKARKTSPRGEKRQMSLFDRQMLLTFGLK